MSSPQQTLKKSRAVGILIFENVEVLDFAGPFEVFSVAGAEIPDHPFTVFTVGLSEAPVQTYGSMTVTPRYSLSSCPALDILLVPGGIGTRPLLQHAELLAWITTRAKQVELLLSVCTGAMLLAQAGLLHGLLVTTHHTTFDYTAALDPTMEIIRDQRFVDNGHIITAGGISAGIDMALYVVDRLLGVGANAPVIKEMEWQWHQTPPQSIAP